MRITQSIVLVWLVALAGAAACSDEETDDTSTDAFCRGLCHAVDRCLGGNNTCSSACPSSGGAEDFSVEGARHLGECMENIDCGTLSDETAFNDFFQECWQSSKPLTPVTEAVRSTCTSYVEAGFECGAIYSQVDCERDLRMFSDGILGQVRDCMTSACLGRTCRPSCEALEACLEDVFRAP